MKHSFMSSSVWIDSADVIVVIVMTIIKFVSQFELRPKCGRATATMTNVMPYLWCPVYFAPLMWPTPLQPGVGHTPCVMELLRSEGPAFADKGKKNA